MEEIKRYRVVIAGVVLLAMVGVTWWAVTANSGETPEAEEDLPEVPEVEQNEITEIQITRPEDDAPIRLTKSGDAWRIAAPIEGPAARTNVDSLLEKLSSLEIVGVASRQARHHERFELDAEHGIHVVARAGSREAINLWIGGFGDGNTFVRLDGQDEVLMAHGSIKFAFNRAANDWRDRAITELEANDAREITFTSTNGTFRFRKNGESWEQVLEAPEGGEAPAAIENFDQAKVRTIVGRVARLRATDFAAADVTAESAGLGESAARVTLVTGEGESAVTTVLLVGNEVNDHQRYVMREGGDGTIFIVSRPDAERLFVTAEAFQTVPGAEGEEAESPPEGGEMPPMPGGGGGEIPPELMRQIQEQLRQQGGGHP